MVGSRKTKLKRGANEGLWCSNEMRKIPTASQKPIQRLEQIPSPSPSWKPSMCNTTSIFILHIQTWLHIYLLKPRPLLPNPNNDNHLSTREQQLNLDLVKSLSCANSTVNSCLPWNVKMRHGACVCVSECVCVCVWDYDGERERERGRERVRESICMCVFKPYERWQVCPMCLKPCAKWLSVDITSRP